jgi:hypothetical protein
MGSLLAGQNFDLNPPEAFVFGAAILLHDAGMTQAATPFPEGFDIELEKTSARPRSSRFLFVRMRRAITLYLYRS